jgi:glucan biosynthesis protein C
MADVSNSSGVTGRRYDIDWLRIAAVLLLIPFHTSRVFNAGEDFYAKHRPESWGITRYWITFVSPWHMSLLFFLAGAATWLAMRHRSGGAYAKERFLRLLAPFVFGCVVLIPPQGFFAMLTNTDRHDSYAGQFVYFFTHVTDLNGYDGAWTPGHLWFILFLFLFSLAGLPAFLWLRNRVSGKKLVGALAWPARFPLALVLPAVALSLLTPVDVMEISGQTLLCFFALFVFGFLMVADPRLVRAVDRHWPWMLALGLAAMVARVALWPFDSLTQPWQGKLVGEWMYEFGVWFMILGLVGLFHRVACRPSRALA